MFCPKCGRKYIKNECFCLGSDKLSKQSVLFLYALVIMIPSTIMIINAMRVGLLNIDYIVLGHLALGLLLIILLALDLLFKKPFLALFFGCHQHTHKSFKIGKKYIVLCSRCTGIFIGVFISLFVAFYFQSWFLMLLGLPLIVDGALQKFTDYQSNNYKRVVSGLLFGFLLSYLFSLYNYIVIYAANWFLNSINIQLLN